MKVKEIQTVCQQILAAANNITVSGTQNMAQILGICNAVQAIHDGVADLEDKNKSVEKDDQKG